MFIRRLRNFVIRMDFIALDITTISLIALSLSEWKSRSSIAKNYYICKSTPLDDGELTELIINDIKRSFNIKDESNKTMKKPMKTETKKKTSISDESENRYVPEIKNVIFNYPSTTVLWSDGTKTVVKCQKGDKYSMETGLALCIAKKALGNNSDFNDIFKKWIDEPQEKDIEYFERLIEQLTKGIRFI